MSQKLLVEVKGKEDVGHRLRMLVAAEKSARLPFAKSHSLASLWVRFDQSFVGPSEASVLIESTDDIKDLLAGLRYASENEEVDDEGFRPDIIFLDSVEQLQRVLLTERLRQEHREYIKGDDYNWMAATMGAIFRSFTEMDIHFVAFTGIKRVNPEGDRSYISPSLFGSFGEQVTEYVDYSLCLDYVRKVTDISVDLEVSSTNKLQLLTTPSPKYPWIFDSTGSLGSGEVESTTLDSIIEAREEFVESLPESRLVDLTIPEDDDKVELPKGMSNSDKIQTLLEKGTNKQKDKEKK